MVKVIGKSTWVWREVQQRVEVGQSFTSQLIVKILQDYNSEITSRRDIVAGLSKEWVKKGFVERVEYLQGVGMVYKRLR